MGYRGSVDKESGYFLKYLLQKQLMGTDNKSVPINDLNTDTDIKPNPTQNLLEYNPKSTLYLRSSP